jgi:hypothetical protein
VLERLGKKNGNQKNSKRAKAEVHR